MPIRAPKAVRVGLWLLLGVGCRSGSESDSPPAAPAAASSLTDRAWVRSDSTGLPGVMRIFLRDSTLVIDSCWETYRLARWQMEIDSALRWQEDASDIRATVRTLYEKELILLVSR
jgi:hypothetical protein